MRKLSITLFLFFNVLTIASFAQNQPKEQKVKKGYGEPVSQTQPEFPGGTDSLTAFIGRNLRFPREAAANREQGKVYIGFTVDRTGKIKDINILSGVSTTIDNEAKRIVAAMPNWKPGTIGGNATNMQYILAIDFILPKSD
jgi:TonB family protein